MPRRSASHPNINTHVSLGVCKFKAWHLWTTEVFDQSEVREKQTITTTTQAKRVLMYDFNPRKSKISHVTSVPISMNEHTHK